MRLHKLMRVVGLLVLLAPAWAMAAKDAEPSTSVWDQLTPAWDSVSDKLIANFGEEKQKRLADLAFAFVGAELCDGIALDQDKFKSEFESLIDANYKDLSPADREQYTAKLMTYYGIYTGLLYAVGLQEQKPFCSYALKQQVDGKVPFWTLVKLDNLP